MSRTSGNGVQALRLLVLALPVVDEGHHAVGAPVVETEHVLAHLLGRGHLLPLRRLVVGEGLIDADQADVGLKRAGPGHDEPHLVACCGVQLAEMIRIRVDAQRVADAGVEIGHRRGAADAHHDDVAVRAGLVHPCRQAG